MNWFTDMEETAARRILDAIAHGSFRKELSKVLYEVSTERFEAGKAAAERRLPPVPPARPTMPRMLTAKEVCEVIGLRHASLYRYLHEGRFPKPLRVGQRAVRWRLEEIEEWLNSRPR